MMGDRYGWCQKPGSRDETLNASFDYVVNNYPKLAWVDGHRQGSSVTKVYTNYRGMQLTPREGQPWPLLIYPTHIRAHIPQGGYFQVICKMTPIYLHPIRQKRIFYFKTYFRPMVGPALPSFPFHSKRREYAV